MQRLANRIKMSLWNDRYFYLVVLFFLIAGFFAGGYSGAISDSFNQYISDTIVEGIVGNTWLSYLLWLIWGYFCMTMLIILAGYYALTFPICLGVLIYWGIRMVFFLKSAVGRLNFFFVISLFLVYVICSICYCKMGVESLKSSIYFFKLRSVAKTPGEKLLYGKAFVKKCAIIFGILVILSILECSIQQGAQGDQQVSTLLLSNLSTNIL